MYLYLYLRDYSFHLERSIGNRSIIFKRPINMIWWRRSISQAKSTFTFSLKCLSIFVKLWIVTLRSHYCSLRKLESEIFVREMSANDATENVLFAVPFHLAKHFECFIVFQNNFFFAFVTIFRISTCSR